MFTVDSVIKQNTEEKTAETEDAWNMFMSSLPFLLLQMFAPLVMGVDARACRSLDVFAPVKWLVLQFIVLL
jgi:hypothetical protein